jgi:valyl-tRNA synthetase
MQSSTGIPACDRNSIVPELLSTDDRHLLLRLHETIRKVNQHLEAYRFNDYSHELYSFIWHDYCDWYVEYAKEPLNSEDAARKQHTVAVMHEVFRTALKLLHPLMPFLTEELWHELNYGGEACPSRRSETARGDFLMKADWPKSIAKDQREAWKLTEANMEFVDAKRDVIRVARQLRSDYNLKPSQQISYVVRPTSAEVGYQLEQDIASINRLVRGTVNLDAEYEAEGAVPALVSKAGNVFMPVEGLIDIDAEVERLQKQLKELEGHINRAHGRLNNENFVSKAPAEVIEQQRAQQKELIGKADKVRALLKSLQA